MTMARKAKVFWPLLLIVLLTDCTTKHAAVASLETEGSSVDVFGESVRFTLVYNDGAAMGLIGPWAKEWLGGVSLVLAVVLLSWYRSAPPGATVLAAATALVIAGGLGNGWQRLLRPEGVVDFIDLGLGPHRFYIFNVADIAVNVGAVLLLVAMTRGAMTEARAEPAS
jgi:signal peptidase II